LQDPVLETADEDIQKSMRQTAKLLKDAGHTVRKQNSPVSFADIQEQHRLTMEYEIGRFQRELLDKPKGSVGPYLREAIERGLEISEADYFEARRAIDNARNRLLQSFPRHRCLPVARNAKDSAQGPRMDGRRQLHLALDRSGRAGRDHAIRAVFGEHAHRLPPRRCTRHRLPVRRDRA
ncbi:MAG: hypothetical protein OXT01_18685, partial [Rhodospirillaceae bacterium]|nr:hypothetical protein [Rhodospirillaceae bacterium]